MVYPMNRRRLPILVVLGALLVAGCATTGTPSPTPEPASATAHAFAIRTAALRPQACMAALMTGKLARNPGSGLGLDHGPAGPPTVVEWPFRYSARDEGGQIALLDETGRVVAREGDTVQMGGGLGQLNIWYTCGPVEVIPPS